MTVSDSNRCLVLDSCSLNLALDTRKRRRALDRDNCLHSVKDKNKVYPDLDSCSLSLVLDTHRQSLALYMGCNMQWAKDKYSLKLEMYSLNQECSKVLNMFLRECNRLVSNMMVSYS